MRTVISSGGLLGVRSGGDLVGRPICSGCRVPSAPLCSDCRTKVARALDRPPPRPIRRLIVPWRYDGPVKGLVLDLKLRGWRTAAGPLVGAMADAVWSRGLAGSLLTWVPARSADVRRRGFDHAAVLAEGLGDLLGLPVVGLLERAGAAEDQAGLSARERRRNLERAFIARPSAGHVILVDDVITTGATLSACAQALEASGASSVEAVVACSA